MKPSVVLLWVKDGSLLVDLRHTVAAVLPDAQCITVAAADEYWAAVQAQAPVLTVLCADTAQQVLSATASAAPQAALLGRSDMHTVVLFRDVTDARRVPFAEAGVVEHLLAPVESAAAFGPLRVLLERLVGGRALRARLDQATRQFKTLIDNSNDGMYLLSGGRFVYTNHRFQDMVGFSERELLEPQFSILQQLVSDRSQEQIQERLRLQAAGLSVESRYEFLARRKNGETFNAQVSVGTVEVELESGARGPCTLGIIQDITARKQFEQQILRKNRELELLNNVATSISRAVALDETLAQSCRRFGQLLDAAATGVLLVSPDRNELQLRYSHGLPDDVARSMLHVPLNGSSMVAHAVNTRDVVIVDDIASDPRVAIDIVRAAPFSGCSVVPLIAGDRNERHPRVIGALFAFLPRGRKPEAQDTELLVALSTLLGNAAEKAALLEREKSAVRKLVALDEIAVSVASTLDVNAVAETVAKSLHRLLGATWVVVARLERDVLVPLYALDEGEPAKQPPIPVSDTIMGECVVDRVPIERVRSTTATPHERLLPYEADLFLEGIGSCVAVPVVVDDVAVGALWVGYAQPEPLSDQHLSVLTSIGMHVSVAMKNAGLFAARNQALAELQMAQDKLVQSEKLNAIGLIAHGVAHDFNNVLGSILGRAQLLKTQLQKAVHPDAALIKHTEVIEQAAGDGAETVRRIHEIGRTDGVDDFVAIDLNHLLDDTAELTRPKWHDGPLAEGRAISLRINKAAQATWVKGNPHQLREVLMNLVHNAVDAMPHGGDLVLTTCVIGDACELQVKDTGTGIPDDVLARIFDPYFTTKGKSGTGLGLSVSDSIIRRHGGTVSANSNTSGTEHGTTFAIALPRQPHGAPAAEPAAIAKRTLPGARILVIDDEENIREILSEILLSGDHNVVTAVDGAEALHILKTDGDFDLVFTDLGLPGMNGYEVASEVKRLLPHLPVALVTGWGATLDADKARKNGVDMVISKPFRFEQVLATVTDALDRR